MKEGVLRKGLIPHPFPFARPGRQQACGGRERLQTPRVAGGAGRCSGENASCPIIVETWFMLQQSTTHNLDIAVRPVTGDIVCGRPLQAQWQRKHVTPPTPFSSFLLTAALLLGRIGVCTYEKSSDPLLL